MSRALPRFLRVSVLLVGFSVFFTLCLTILGFVEVERRRDLFPTVRYAAPSFSPEVVWTAEKPRGWVSISSLPTGVWAAVLASEDSRFFTHAGIDYSSVSKGFRRALQMVRRPRGMSTVTQQVAKNLYLAAAPAPVRKVPEAAIALWLDREMGKKKLLEIYLNTAEWGEGIVGIGQASRVYFGKSVTTLNGRQAAILANLLPNPRGRGADFIRGRASRSFLRKVFLSELRAKRMASGFRHEVAKL